MHGAIWDSRRLRVARRPRRPEYIEPHVVRWAEHLHVLRAMPSQKTVAQGCPRQTCPPLRKLHYSKISISILKNLASSFQPYSGHGPQNRCLSIPDCSRTYPNFDSRRYSRNRSRIHFFGAPLFSKPETSGRQAGRKLKKMIQYKCDQAPENNYISADTQ